MFNTEETKTANLQQTSTRNDVTYAGVGANAQMSRLASASVSSLSTSSTCRLGYYANEQSGSVLLEVAKASLQLRVEVLQPKPAIWRIRQ